MSAQKVFKENSMNMLLESLGRNISSYAEESTWVEEKFSGHSLKAVTKISALDPELLLIPDDESDHDLENSERLYMALHGLSLTQAADPRLWTYLSHVTFWKYMRKRWPIEKMGRGAGGEKAVSSVRSRYFLIGDKSRGLTRHGIARLWWAGYTCHTPSTAGIEFSLARPLFVTQDVYASFMERAFSKNRNIMHALLRVLKTKLEAGVPFDDREHVRGLAKYLVLLGGAMVLDALNSDELESIVNGYLATLDGEEVTPSTEC